MTQAEIEQGLNRAVLQRELQAQPPAPPLRIFQRTSDVLDSLLLLCERRLTWAGHDTRRAAAAPALRQRLDGLRQRYEQLRTDLERVVTDRQLDRIPGLVTAAQALLVDADRLAADQEQRLEVPPPTEAEQHREILADTDRLLAESERLLAAEVGGLTPVQIDMDDALATALNLRLDLLNQRESLADAWRQVKLAADDLKSILNLRATQQIGVREFRTQNQPPGNFSDTHTQLQVSFDAPLNRRAERNLFRTALIDYNQALRNLQASEDAVKATVRDDLRQLQVNREQYRIAVASAALAYERVVSTRLQLMLGVQKVTARDWLEAQQAYTNSLSAMARAHVTYLIDRIDLFLDLELLQVDDQGFWPQVDDERYQPSPNFQTPAYSYPAYGELPRVHYSRRIRRQLDIPVGEPEVFRPDARPPAAPEPLPAQEAPPAEKP